MLVKVYVRLKKGILDPQGKAIENALPSLGFKNVDGVRVGKYIELNIEGNDEKRVKTQVEEMCARILANPVIEDYSYRIEGEAN